MTTFVTRINVQFNALLLLLFFGLSPFTLRHNAWVVGAWRETGMLKAANTGHAARLLPSGKVLVVGANSIETYDPATELWDRISNGITGDFTLTLLRDGRLLLAGNGASVYDSLSNTTQSVTTPNDPDRFNSSGGHSATVLPNGKVLLAGGVVSGNMLTPAAYLYDPATNAWSRAANMKFAHAYHSASLLPNGKVLLAGGFLNRQAQTEAEIYDPVTNTWTQTGSLRAARSGQTTTTLADGRVLVVGGTTGLLAFAEIYDPTVGSWVTTGNLNEARQTTDAVLLRDGRVLVAGGNILSGSDSRSLSSAELFDPATNRWTLIDPLPTTRERHSLTLLPSGLVLAAGGKNDGGTLRRADLFDPSKAMAMIPSTPSPKITAASASSFRGGSFSPESIVSVFGTQLANTTQAADSVPLPLLMGGVRVWVGNTTLTASPLYYVSPNQINFQIPAGTPLGSMTIQLFPSGLTDYVVINRVEPGLFSADSTGKGLAAAVALRIKANGEQVYEPVSRFDPTQNKVVAVPIDLSNTKEQVFLILSGSGWRNRSSLSAVTASVGGTTVEVLYAGLQGDFVGLDQANLRLPNSLAGRGNVQVQLTVDGIAANAVTISIK